MRLVMLLRRLGRESGGGALVEATLLMPLLVGLMCGLAEFGLMLRQYAVMDKGVRDAARFVARAAGTTECPTPGWSGAVETAARNLVLSGSPTGGPPLIRTFTDPTDVNLSASSCQLGFRGPAAGVWSVTVTASAPYDDLGLLSFLSLAPPTLTVAHEQLVIGE